MKIALYHKSESQSTVQGLDSLKMVLSAHGISYISVADTLPDDIDFLFSIGGDGTLLSSVHLVGNKGVPIVGINFGHLGFLTTAGVDDLETLVADLQARHYSLEQRTLLQASSTDNPQQTYLALNEVALHRAAEVILLQTQVYVNNNLVSNYIGDGLIVATPTGSTAYSLSCGGPILTPDSGCFVITPIAAHSLSLRPMVVPDTATIRLVADLRGNGICMSADSEMNTLRGGSVVEIKRADFCINLLRLHHHTFFTAMHEKLQWGSI